MSRRRNPRRAVAAQLPCSFDSDTSDSDSDIDYGTNIDFLLNYAELLTKTLKSKKTNSKRKSGAGTSKKPTKKINNSTRKNTTLAPSTKTAMDKTETVIDIDLCNLKKNIGSKVDTIFKENNLISDDDDVDILTENMKPRPIVSKEFYTLSDSDDDLPCTSNCNLNNDVVSAATNITENTEQLKKDELMDIVDEILDCDDVPLEVNIEQDKSWSEYKKKTEEILGSVSALLEDFKKHEEPEKKTESKEESEEKKPSCPICLENFGGGVTAASTLCGHIFCNPCIKEVAKTTKKCPTCRKTINLKKVHPVYL